MLLSAADLLFRYHFATVECRAYLPPYENVTIYFLKALITGAKKFIHTDKVQYLSVPQYEGLGIKEFFSQAGKYDNTPQYFPDADDLRKLPRQWVINVTYTLVGKPFADWVHARMEARNQQLVEKHDMAILMDPEVLRIFNASTHVSSKCRSFVSKLLTFSFVLPQP